MHLCALVRAGRQGAGAARASLAAVDGARGLVPGEGADQRALRAAVLHSLRRASALPEGARALGLHGAAVGPLHHAGRRLPAAHRVNACAAMQSRPLLYYTHSLLATCYLLLAAGANLLVHYITTPSSTT